MLGSAFVSVRVWSLVCSKNCIQEPNWVGFGFDESTNRLVAIALSFQFAEKGDVFLVMSSLTYATQRSTLSESEKSLVLSTNNLKISTALSWFWFLKKRSRNLPLLDSAFASSANWAFDPVVLSEAPQRSLDVKRSTKGELDWEVKSLSPPPPVEVD